MESLSSESKSIALDILEDILSAIGRLEDRTKDVQTTDPLKSVIMSLVWRKIRNFASQSLQKF